MNYLKKKGETLIGSVFFIYGIQKRDGQQFTCEVHRNGKNLQNYKRSAKITFNAQAVQLEKGIVPKSGFVGSEMTESCDLDAQEWFDFKI